MWIKPTADDHNGVGSHEQLVHSAVLPRPRQEGCMHAAERLDLQYHGRALGNLESRTCFDAIATGGKPGMGRGRCYLQQVAQ